MKPIHLIISICLFFSLKTNLSFSQNQQDYEKSKTWADIGILDIFDKEINFNHNQVFKKFLQENEFKVGKRAAIIDLVEHPSQSKIAIRAIIEDSLMTLSIYSNGALFLKDTLSLAPLYKKELCFAPAFRLIEGDAGEFIITGLSDQSQENFDGLRNGSILTKVEGVKVKIGQKEKAEQLLKKPKQKKLKIDFINPKNGKSYNYHTNTYHQTLIKRNKPWTHEDLKVIFEMISYVLIENQMKLDFYQSKKLSFKSLMTIYPINNNNKTCNSQDQISANISFSHPVSFFKKSPKQKGIGMHSIFENEYFYFMGRKYNRNNAGDAALFVMRYYNYDQNRSNLLKSGKVSPTLKAAVRKLSGPFYNKPGVFVNFYIAGLEYEDEGNYPAALNQYYASVRKVDEMIASNLSKIRAKKKVSERIAHCSKQLGQNNYSDLMGLATECLEKASSDPTLIKGDENFMKISTDISSICKDIESQISEQKWQNTMAVIQAASNVAAGIASFNLDAGLATNFFTFALEVLVANDEYNQKLNQMISTSTSSIVINLPAELQNEETSPYEIKATEFILNSLLESENDKEIFDILLSYAIDKPEIKDAIDQTIATKSITGKLDPTDLLNVLLKHETIIYRFEKRGLTPPKKV